MTEATYTKTGLYGFHSTPFGGRYAYVTTFTTEVKDYDYASGPMAYTTERRYIAEVSDPARAELFARRPEIGQPCGSSNYPAK